MMTCQSLIGGQKPFGFCHYLIEVISIFGLLSFMVINKCDLDNSYQNINWPKNNAIGTFLFLKRIYY